MNALNGGDGFELLEIDSSAFSSAQSLIYKYAIFDTGTYTSPEIEFVIGQGAEAETLRTEVHSVEIRTTLSDSVATIQPNKANRAPEFSLLDEIEEKGRWGLPILILLALIASLWWWRKKKRSQAAGEVGVPEIVLPPHEIAVKELIALRDKKYPERGLLKEFFSEFSEIIRRYIENRYGFRRWR